MTPSRTSSSTLARPRPRRTSVARAITREDFDAGAVLLGEQRQWLASAIGDAALTHAEPEPGPQYRDPHDHYRPGRGALLLARIGASPAGIVAVERAEPGVAELKHLYVRPLARGFNLGRRLVYGAIATAVAMNASTLRLETDPLSMATAVALYREAGFVETEARVFAHVPTAIGMELDLVELTASLPVFAAGGR